MRRIFIFILFIMISLFNCTGEEGQNLFIIKLNGKFGYIDKSGEVMITPKFPEAQSYSEGLAAVKINKLWGYIDADGNIKIEPSFEWASPFKEGRAKVYTREHISSFIDTTGKILVPRGFKSLIDYQEGYAAVNNGDKWGFINSQGNLVIDYKYESSFFTGDGLPESVMRYQPYGFFEGRVMVSLNGKFGFIDEKGNAITNCIFYAVNYYQSGLTYVYINDKAGIIGKDGKYISKIEYDYVGIITDSLIAVSKNKKYGFIDHDGTVVIPFQYDEAESFIGGRGKIGIKDSNGKMKYGFIDTKGNQVIKPMYDKVYTFDQKGYAVVELGNKSGLIDKEGKYVINLTQNIHFESQEGYRYGDKKRLYYREYVIDGIIVYQDSNTEKFGYMNINGKRITDPIFDYTEQFENGIAYVNVNDRFGYIDPTGKYIWKPSK